MKMLHLKGQCSIFEVQLFRVTEDIKKKIALLETMKHIVNTVEITRSFRQKGIKRSHKMPIKHIYLLINDSEAIKMLKNNNELNKILMDELNVLNITYDSDVGKYLKFKIKLDFKVAGKILGKNLKKVQNLLENLEDSKINNWRQNMDEPTSK